MRKRFAPGRVRLKLAEQLAHRLSADGHKVCLNPETLWPARGYWRTSFYADVYRWEGQFQIWRHDKWVTVSVISWSPMTDCIRGFDYEWATGYQLEVTANIERVHPALARAKALRVRA